MAKKAAGKTGKTGKTAASGKTSAKSRSKAPAKTSTKAASRWWLRPKRLAVLIPAGIVVLALALVALNSVVRPFQGTYMHSEARRLGGITRDWVPIEDVAPVMLRSVVAAEDANFCEHWGFDMSAIRDAIADGMSRGGSTITQQVAKNVYLWNGRSYVRKALEALFTPAIELFWTKKRILEVYLNVAEFGEGIFGVQAAAQHYFGVDASKLSPTQAARLAAVLPAPQRWSPTHPDAWVLKRSRRIVDGAATIFRDGRDVCFDD